MSAAATHHARGARPRLLPRLLLGAALCAAALSACGGEAPALAPRVWHVHPGQDIQAALELAADAAREPGAAQRVVRVHAGVYRPARPGQALIWLNARHDGIVLEALGEVVLTAANEDLSDPSAESHPAVVNHVVYFGDGVSSATVLRGFRITGANHFVTRAEDPGPVQPFTPVAGLHKALFFYSDGGAIKIFGRSYPTIESVRVHDNYASPCAGGISIEHRGFKQGRVTIRDSVFERNSAQITGSAIDLLPGSAASIENCLFVGNVSNTGEDFVSSDERVRHTPRGSGALTVFEQSSVEVRRCTFTGNWNGVDDRGRGSVYVDSIFWRNTAAGGIQDPPRYELDLLDGVGVRGCLLGGDLLDVRGTIDAARNVLDAPDPDFDAQHRPRAEAYARAGYRPPDERREQR